MTLDQNKLALILEGAFDNEELRKVMDGITKPTPAVIAHVIAALVKSAEAVIEEVGQGELKKAYVIEAFKQLKDHYHLAEKLDQMIDFVKILSPLGVYGIVIGEAIELVDEQVFDELLNWSIEGAVGFMHLI